MELEPPWLLCDPPSAGAGVPIPTSPGRSGMDTTLDPSDPEMMVSCPNGRSGNIGTDSGNIGPTRPGTTGFITGPVAGAMPIGIKGLFVPD